MLILRMGLECDSFAFIQRGTNKVRENTLVKERRGAGAVVTDSWNKVVGLVKQKQRGSWIVW